MNEPTNNDKKVHRAGTIPYIIENGKIEMMFMQPSDPAYGGSEFQIAKGKIEENETAKDAALREAKEEIGLFIGNITLVEEVGLFMGRTTVFIAKVKDKDMFGAPGEETGNVAWLTPDQFMDEGRILHKPVVQAAVRKIKKIEHLE